MKKGFTLIEMLVVASIISLLASVVLVSLKNVREGAINAKGLQFDSNIYHGIGYEAIGVWNFDEGSGVIANDSHGNNDGDLKNMESTDWKCSSDETSSGKGCSLLFGGSVSGDNEGIYVDTIPSLESKVTVSFWAKSNGNFRGYALAKPNASFYAIWLDQTNGASPHFSTVINGNSSYKTYYDIPFDSWTHIVSTFDDTANILKHYINGEEVDSWNVTFSIPANSDYGLMIGARCSTAFPYNCNVPYWSFGGYIDEVKLYKESLSSADVLKIYAERLQRQNNLCMK